MATCCIGVLCALSSLQLILVHGQACDTFGICDCLDVTYNSTFYSMVDCSFRGLTEVPLGLPVDRHTYDFSGNQVDVYEFLSMMFSEEPMFKTLIFDRNKLQELPNLPSLPPSHEPIVELISLKECQVEKINEGTFNGLTRLQTIHLELNKITSLPVKIFRSLEALCQLFMDNNELTTIPPGLFETNTQLREISFQNNKLTSLPDYVFATIAIIASLNLGGNDLHGFNGSIFRESQQIIQLIYAPNPLTCDCSIRGLFNFAQSLKDDFGGKVDADCSYPDDSGQDSINDIDSNLFIECDDQAIFKDVTTLPKEETQEIKSATIMVSAFAITGTVMTVAVGVSLYIALNNTKPLPRMERQGRQSKTGSSLMVDCCNNRCFNKKRNHKQKITDLDMKGTTELKDEKDRENTKEDSYDQGVRLDTV